ncbi:MAG: hypothetical protein IJS26_06195 [Alphaproteobacteria bacterium]|nr:hypothetical protein [Alphaproteobacteria bacterium]
MADDLNKNAEFSGKHNDEGNPILVAQRYLNIYNQLHIFNAERRKEFDESLLNMPIHIRMLMSTIPGGSLLLEHIAKLESERGIAAVEVESEKAAQSPSETSESEQVKKKSKEEESPVKAPKENTVQNANINTMTGNLLKFLKKSEEKRDQEMELLMSAFLQSQESIASTLKEVLLETQKRSEQMDLIRSQGYERQQLMQGGGLPAYSGSVLKTQETSASDENVSVSSETVATSQPVKTNEQPSTPKFFGLGRMFFGSKKSAGEKSAISDVLKPAQEVSSLDDTPVSLDDIPDNPVSLDETFDDAVFSSTESEPSVEESPSNTQPDETPSDSDDWEWEYVEDTSDDGQAPEGDDEWEYVEVEEPEAAFKNDDQSQDEQAAPSDLNDADDDEWVYVDDLEEPQESEDEPTADLPNDKEWEYIELGEDEEETDAEDDSLQEPVMEEETKEPSKRKKHKHKNSFTNKE